MSVEYTYKNTASSRACSITLENDYLTLQSTDKEDTISYAQVKSVKLERLNSGLFRMTLYTINLPPIEVTNKYQLGRGEVEDRSKQYSMFVRTLHFHLKSKSASEYKSGLKSNLIFIWLSLAAFAACFFTFIGEYFSWTLINPFLQAAILTVGIAAAICIVNRKKLVQLYSPSEIPFQFLP